jgi:hypothetical protein
MEHEDLSQNLEKYITGIQLVPFDSSADPRNLFFSNLF